MNLSFRTAQKLRGLAELLPKGPKWQCKPWTTLYPTKKKLNLYYRDPLECIQTILHSPVVKDFIQFTPFRVFESATKAMRIYSEWLSGNTAWSMQVSSNSLDFVLVDIDINHWQDQLPDGATILGVILSSDKTSLTSMTGGRVAHPLLISLANLVMDFRGKATNHAFQLLALLPVPKFIHEDRKTRGVLEYRLIHECLDFILKPLKKAAEIGVMLSDAVGSLRYAFTPLAGYIVDVAEAVMLSGVAGKTSHLTMANYKQFGDPYQHEPRTASTTLAQLHAIEEDVDPWDFQKYLPLALKNYRLNGVHRPFWRDWPLSDPSKFFMPEPLHHWHKMFWDHDAKWAIKAVGHDEIDFRFSILHPHTGYRQFSEGISKLKQVTGREHRDIQRYIIAVIADAVPPDFLIALRALADFRYLAQAPEISDTSCTEIKNAIDEFHDHKDIIISIGARTGKRKRAIKDWQIPKLELLQSVVSSTQDGGVPIQWSADATERCHITEIKDPSRSTNNQNYESQICRYLDRNEKCRRFDLATAICQRQFDNAQDDCHPGLEDPGFTSGSGSEDDIDDAEGQSSAIDTTSDLLASIQLADPASRTLQRQTNYFKLANALENGQHPQAPQPYRTFVGGGTALHLTRDATMTLSVKDAMEKFALPDLRGALVDFITRLENNSALTIGGRRSADPIAPLPFDDIQIWARLQIQNKSYHAPHDPLPPQTVNASPPSDLWMFGRSDITLINTDPSQVWPSSGLKGIICIFNTTDTTILTMC